MKTRIYAARAGKGLNNILLLVWRRSLRQAVYMDRFILPHSQLNAKSLCIADIWNPINPWRAKLNYLNFHTLEVMSRYRDT